MKSLGEEMLLSDTLGNQKNQFSTLVEILQQRASSEPAQIAYTYLANGETPEDRLTYQQLDCKAKAIAAYLQSCISPGDRAVLIYPQGLEFLAAFFGCLYAGVIAIPTPAPEASNLKRSLPRLLSIIEDSKTAAILTTTSLQSQLINHFAEFEINQQIRWYATDTIAEKLSEKCSEPVINTDTIAYLQYTSGSTSTPKGVILTHKNLICHLADLQQAGGYDNNSITVTWMPYFHDYGLVEGLLQPLYNGTTCYLMSPFAFIKKPFNWLQAISRYKATHSQAPNFAYDYCVRQIRAEQRDKLDLSSWQAAGNGAEPINPEVMESFCKTFASCGFRFHAFAPGYGLAEATLVVTISRKKESPVFCNFSAEELTKNRIIEDSNGKKLAGAGRLLQNTKVAIVHPETFTQCAANEIGEIWVTSRGVAQGYWQRPDVTKETFQAYLADTKEGPFLRTGDLGFIKDGELFVTGRFKDLIIIRGENYYPQDIEWIVEKSHPALRSAAGAAFSVEIDGTEQIVIVQEIERSAGKTLNSVEVITSIRKAIAEELELPVYGVVLLKRGTIPKTSSGKIQRQACRAAFLNGSLDSIDAWKLNSESIRQVIEPRNELELQLLQIWQKILGIASISIKDNFFQLGGDSLKAANLALLVEEILNIKIPLATVMEAPTIEKLALYLQQLNRKRNYNSLVAIRSQGSKQPFFYVDGLGANIVNCTNLERFFDPERPFYVLHPAGLDGEKTLPTTPTTIEEIASDYLREIQTIQPQGPYLLGGYCMGAMVAFEMVHQLEKQGQSVLKLVMVEGLNPLTEAEKTFHYQQKLKREIEIRNNLIKQGWTLGQLENLLKVWQAQVLAILNYMPKGNTCEIIYFASEQHQHESRFNPIRQLGWAEFTNGYFEIETVPGNHLSMHLEPNVKILAERLNFHLERAAEKANSKVFLQKQSRLQQIQGDLALSRLKLQHFQAYLEKMFS
ncbi:MAG TPA: AMP-binding protein [Halomicronema sp.]